MIQDETAFNSIVAKDHIRPEFFSKLLGVSRSIKASTQILPWLWVRPSAALAFAPLKHARNLG